MEQGKIPWLDQKETGIEYKQFAQPVPEHFVGI
jgi:hypothetical protein